MINIKRAGLSWPSYQAHTSEWKAVWFGFESWYWSRDHPRPLFEAMVLFSLVANASWALTRWQVFFSAICTWCSHFFMAIGDSNDDAIGTKNCFANSSIVEVLVLTHVILVFVMVLDNLVLITFPVKDRGNATNATRYSTLRTDRLVHLTESKRK